MRLELNIGANSGAKGNVVVNLAIDCEDDFAVVADQGLGTGICKEVNRLCAPEWLD